MQDLLAATSPAAQKLIENINSTIVNPLVVLLFTLALVAFLWGVRDYVSNADNPEKRAQGAQHILWGIIGMGIMIMAFTIVNIVVKTFGIGHAKIQGGDNTLNEIQHVLGNK